MMEHVIVAPDKLTLNDKAEIKRAVRQRSVNGFRWHRLTNLKSGRWSLESSERKGISAASVVEKNLPSPNACYLEYNGDMEAWFFAELVDGVCIYDYYLHFDWQIKAAFERLIDYEYPVYVETNSMSGRSHFDFTNKSWPQKLNFIPVHSVLTAVSNADEFWPSEKILTKLDSLNKTISLAVILAVIGLVIWIFWGGNNTPKVVEEKDIYQDYRAALISTGINIKGRMVQLYDLYDRLDKLSGWKVTRIIMKGTSTFVYIENAGGTSPTLSEFANQNNLLLAKEENAYVLSRLVPHAPINTQAIRPPVDGLRRYIEDALRDKWPEAVFRTINTRAKDKGKQAEEYSEIAFKKWTKEDLDSLSSVLNGWTYGFVGLDIKAREQFVEGVITIVSYGYTTQKGTK